MILHNTISYIPKANLQAVAHSLCNDGGWVVDERISHLTVMQQIQSMCPAVVLQSVFVFAIQYNLFVLGLSCINVLVWQKCRMVRATIIISHVL